MFQYIRYTVKYSCVFLYKNQFQLKCIINKNNCECDPIHNKS